MDATSFFEEILVQKTGKGEAGSIGEEPRKSAITSPSSAGGIGKPYLTALPPDPTDNTLVMEWLEYLLQHAQYREVMRAIEYYETINWVTEDVADDLQGMVCCFDDIDGSNSSLTIDNHKQSLQYISQLADDSDAEAALLSKLVNEGDGTGV